ncbi:helix-turn-helix domain-containing protein [Halorussus sp. AFM4]|uniref:helix-turn-helix domain-containing protein n=1 Tax=Halorussus sp. AFM4 TaxID=3421651 RepID=UPI003EBBA774
MKRVRFSIRYPDRLAHPIHRRVAGDAAVTRAELLLWSPTADATTLLWCDGDRAATESVVAGVDSLVASDFVADADGTYAFLRQDDYEFPAALLDTVADAAVIFLPPVVFREAGDVRFEAVGPSAAVSALHDDLSELGEPTVERVRPFERRESPSRLTDRQRAALEAAVAVGYYEVPRSGTVEDVAAALDCSSSTAGELLRKAEAAVVTGYTETP